MPTLAWACGFQSRMILSANYMATASVAMAPEARINCLIV